MLVALTLLSILSTVTYADDFDHDRLLTAVTMCPTPNNPLDGLKLLKGNVFSNPELRDYLAWDWTVRAEVDYDPTYANFKNYKEAKSTKGFITVRVFTNERGVWNCKLSLTRNTF